jgi:hypothetical protein
MTLAALIGATSGAMHAVTGPDHVLSLGPAALRRKRAPWNLGLAWGVGHAFGTLLLAFPALLLARSTYVSQFAEVSDRVAGFALLAMAAYSALQLRAAGTLGGAVESTRNPLVVGFVHGLTGAAALVMMLPILTNGSLAMALAYLCGFAVGSTLAMGALTSALAVFGARLRERVIGIAQRVLLAGAGVLGVVWLVG